MKIALAIDEVEQGNLVLQALRDLRLADPQLRLAHVVEIWDGAELNGVRASASPVQTYFRRIQEWGRDMLRQLQRSAEQQGFQTAEGELLYGNIANELIEYTEKHQCDLLALGSYEKGPMEGLLEGSVGRKAAINCKQSVLIVKPSYRQSSPLSVVLATDHSPAANLWIQQFINWAPAGLQHIHLLTVIPDKLLLLQKEAAGALDVERWINEGIAAEQERVLHRLSILGVPCTSHIEQGNVGTEIARTMEKTQSKLLVLGSQGHGFMERLTMGSVSLEQVTQRRYSVLVVRGVQEV